MVRSMYSGVAGMKAHQTKMDVIGNNIANVNTYGYKAGRVSFQDIYYQTVTGASAGSSSQGGTNPSQIGYGSKVGNIDTLQTRSTFQMTDNGMDLAIAGEGFFQVQDAEGNIFYTRSGMLRFDQSGNLVDPNGNFVLGISGNPLGASAGSDKIQIQLPNVEAASSSVTEAINGATISISSTGKTDAANVTLNFVSSSDIADGQAFDIKASDITSGAITVKINENYSFSSVEEFNNLLNAAVKDANGGKEHPAGKFTVSISGKDVAFPLTGAEITGRNFGVKAGKLELVDGQTSADPAKKLLSSLGIGFESVSSEPAFSSSGEVTFGELEYNDDTAVAPAVKNSWTVTATDADGKVYTGYITSENTGKVQMTNADGSYVIMSHPGTKSLAKAWQTQESSTDAPDNGAKLGSETKFTATASTASKDLGLSSKPMVLVGATEGGAQTMANLTSVSIGQDGIIEAVHPSLGKITVGRVDLVTFANPEGLEASGTSYFVETANSGKATKCEAGKNGSGKLAPGSLEMSNVDLSKEFSDMIVTQRGFQANSRLITVSDEMLTELVNLKR